MNHKGLTFAALYVPRYGAYLLALLIAKAAEKWKEITIATAFLVILSAVGIGLGMYVHPGAGLFAVGALLWVEFKGPWFRSNR